jgi:phosphohistidine phosphatase
MRVYLLRHGDAVAQTENPERPLSSKGRRDVEKTARLALQHDMEVAAIYHSGILRALDTAEILAKVLAPPAELQAHAGLLPEDDPAIVNAELDIIERPIALVGHLPHLRRLAALLVTGDPDRTVIDLLPAMMVCLEKEGDRWKIAWTSAEPII